MSCGFGQQHTFRAPQRVHRIAFEMVSSGVRTRWMHSRRHQLVADRVPHEIRPRGKLELTHDARTVRLDCFHADFEKVSDLHVRVAFCDRMHDLPLAPGQRGRVLALVQKRLEQCFGDFGGKERLVRGERLTGALLDRLTHHVHILEMNGDSYRLAHSKRRSRRPRPDAAHEATASD